nr:putative ribonuclease H-like domain-containing protein [Tanacetum cinerariifolium]
MNEFCKEKGIKKEYSVARTPQQNRVAERRNRILIEAAKTMVLVVKPHLKTLYELFIGRSPALSFMRPFGCHVTILNTLDHLGKFDGKSDEGIFVGYSTISKAFRAYNIRTRKEQTLMILQVKEQVLMQDKHGLSPTSESDNQKRPDAESSIKTVNTAGPVNTATPTYANYPNDHLMPDLEDARIYNDAYDDRDEGAEADYNNLETEISISLTPSTRIHKDHPKEHIIGEVEAMQEKLFQFKLLNVWTLVDLSPRKRAIGTKWVYTNKRDQRGIVVRNKAKLVAQGHRQEEGIDYDEVFAPVARIKAIRLFMAYSSFMDFTVYQMDVKSAFLYGTIEDEVYVSQPLGFVDLEFPDRVYKVEKALYGLHQAPRAWSLSTEFDQLMHKRFQMSSMGKLTLFLGFQVEQQKDGIFLSQDKYVCDILKKFGFSSVKSASTPMETHKPLLKDVAGTDVDVYLYRSMIGSLMYLTSSRPNIMFDVCACSRFQVQPKVSHMHAVKRIFRYLKGQLTLGLWYPKDSPLELIAYSDSDYAGVSLDRKSITGGYQFLSNRLISWQCKKQTIMANSTTEAEYIAASNCCGQVQLVLLYTYVLESLIEALRNGTLCISASVYTFWILRMKCKSGQVLKIGLKLKGYLMNDGYADLVQHADKKELDITGKTTTGKELSNPLMAGSLPKTTLPTQLLNDAEGTSCLPNAMIFEELARMGYEKPSEKLTFYKAFFSPQWKFFIHTILQCLSAKTTSWNEFSSTMASAIICLANNQKFNFLKYILDNLKKNLEADIPIPDASLSSPPQRKHKPRRKEKKERKETEVSLTELPTEDPIPTTSNDLLPSGDDSMQLKELMILCINLSNKVLDLENKVIKMKSSHQAKIAVLESRVEKLEKQNKELKSFISKVESLAFKEAVVDQEKSSKQGRKIADIDADTEVITTAKIIVDKVSTAGGELNAANEEPVSAAPTNNTTAQPSEATKTTVDIFTTPKAKGLVFHDMEESTTRTASLKVQIKDKCKAKLVDEPKVLKLRKAQIAIDAEVARRIKAEWNADMQDNIDWNKVVKQVQSRQSDAVRKYQALKRKPVSVAQARKNMMIYMKNITGFKIEFFKGMSYKEIRPMFEEEYNKVQTLFKKGPKMDAERIKAPRKRTRKEEVKKDQTTKKQKGDELEKKNAEK